MTNLMPYLAPFWTCLVIAIASSCVSITITQTELFASMRTWITQKNILLEHLFHCFYCLSHWIVFVLIALYQPILINGSHVLINLTVTAFVTIGLATLISGLVFNVFLKAMTKAKLERELNA
ncbi:hypothetical protein [Marinomonas sp.]|uniref:hypothetical protein n=1 Tax=Marinomonas sp. TaxID=1904862 RepID=UPI003BAAE891